MSESNTNNQLYRHVFKMVVLDDKSPYHQAVKKLNDIDVDYFEKIPAWEEKLPTELDFQLKDNILKDFDKMADELLSQELKDRLKGELHESLSGEANISAQCDENEVQGIMESLSQVALVYFGQYKPCPEIEEATLQKKYKKSRRRNILERIGQTNNADVIDFHHALMYKTVWECKGLIERRIMCFIEEIIRETIVNNNY